jgi:hypothetical protein
MNIKQLFCNHENKILGEHILTWEGKRYNEIFCDNCKKVLIPSWLWVKMEAYFNRIPVEVFNEK